MFMADFLNTASSKRIHPAEPSKPAEITVIGMEFGVVLDGNRRDMRIRQHPSANPDLLQEIPQNLKMPPTGIQDFHGRTLQP